MCRKKWAVQPIILYVKIGSWETENWICLEHATKLQFVLTFLCPQVSVDKIALQNAKSYERNIIFSLICVELSLLFLLFYRYRIYPHPQRGDVVPSVALPQSVLFWTTNDSWSACFETSNYLPGKTLIIIVFDSRKTTANR